MTVRTPTQANSPSWFAATPQSVLLCEAEKLRDERDWRQARRVLEAAGATAIDDGDRRRVLELTATAAAEASNHRISSNAVYELSRMESRPASTWAAIAAVALARSNYQHADAAAREALALDPDSADTHILLAASFAGLGWFDQASTCLDNVDRSALTSRQRHQIGQAVNHWATTKTLAFPLALLTAMTAGLIAISVGLGIPLLTRRLRLRRLGQANQAQNSVFTESATDSWSLRKKTRALTAISALLPFAYYLSSIF